MASFGSGEIQEFLEQAHPELENLQAELLDDFHSRRLFLPGGRSGFECFHLDFERFEGGADPTQGERGILLPVQHDSQEHLVAER